MNFADICLQLSEEPREIYISSTQTALRAKALIPPVGNKAPTPIEINVYGRLCERFARFKANSLLFVHQAQLRHDATTREYSLHSNKRTVIHKVTDEFPILNFVHLDGRCFRPVDANDSRAFKTLDSGLMICNQSFTVSTGKNKADIFNFYAMYDSTQKYPGPNYPEMILNNTGKGTSLSIEGPIVTDSWKDQKTGETKTQTKIRVDNMLLGFNSQVKTEGQEEIKPQTNVANEANVVSLWGGKTTPDTQAEDNTQEEADKAPDPWNLNTGLPDLPGQYGQPPELEDAPF
jgi:hypothetical protein